MKWLEMNGSFEIVLIQVIFMRQFTEKGTKYLLKVLLTCDN